ncbi:hypothetical protein [Mycolicibacterium fortuitum]|uniref:Uncharacterized protein n=2 Tax=Mycolicibacterium fortuitum TaxID=1766 RepID=A0AAE4VK10_MYCFO|nr:hypothetical protein [Mycolicibacterium fortuitum]MCV7137571.1 hypothetical protein [Mycolicibacterium fortuitum]MDV7195655.1 hypothetical protein [Mycolicibacterium fortuitum]MDV7209330.1 hypothetical protein [Mycolicibacterium fortuitum]MDV7231168.1 hypothetical protein [Mycolicibacterium fortuitum]MDV7262747.1 hypothetical protein [Mycolicibacterium fortuitum]
MTLDDRFFTFVQNPDADKLKYASTLAEFQIVYRVALHPDNEWYAKGERMATVVGVPAGHVRVVLDGCGKKARIPCWELAVIAIPKLCKEVSDYIIGSKDFR